MASVKHEQPASQTTQFRAHEWINTKTLKTVYSIQARIGKSGWANLHERGKPMFFDTVPERDARLKELQSDE